MFSIWPMTVSVPLGFLCGMWIPVLPFALIALIGAIGSAVAIWVSGFGIGSALIAFLAVSFCLEAGYVIGILSLFAASKLAPGQQSHRRDRGWQGQLPLEGKSRREPAKGPDARRRRVHPAFPRPCPAQAEVVKVLRWSCPISHHRTIIRKSMRRLNHNTTGSAISSFSTKAHPFRTHHDDRALPMSDHRSPRLPRPAAGFLLSCFRNRAVRASTSPVLPSAMPNSRRPLSPPRLHRAGPDTSSAASFAGGATFNFHGGIVAPGGFVEHVFSLPVQSHRRT